MRDISFIISIIFLGFFYCFMDDYFLEIHKEILYSSLI